MTAESGRTPVRELHSAQPPQRKLYPLWAYSPWCVFGAHELCNQCPCVCHHPQGTQSNVDTRAETVAP